MTAKIDFDKLHQETLSTLAVLEKGDIGIEQSIVLYKNTTVKINQALKALEKMESQIKEIEADLN